MRTPGDDWSGRASSTICSFHPATCSARFPAPGGTGFVRIVNDNEHLLPMKALNTLRNLIFLFFFAAAAASASASDAPAKPAHGEQVRKQAAHRTAGARRKEVAPFVDPTLPLAELVERARLQNAR